MSVFTGLATKRAIALVTGSASGLGRATAERIARNGGRVIIADLPSSDGEAVAKQIGSDKAIFAPTDVTNPESISNALDLGEQHFGGETLNTVVNCAGIAYAIKTLGKKGPHPQEQFERTLNVNVGGTFNTIRLAAERMAKAEPLNEDGFRGVVINTASVAAFDGQRGQAAYAASKGGIVAMTLPIARDLSTHGIRVNAIAPGVYMTPMVEGLPAKVKTELGAMVPFPSRIGYPDEFAQMVESIMHNAMLNGEVIRLDGALRMPP